MKTKRKYKKPTFKVHGDLKKITKNGGSSSETDAKDFYS